MIMQSNLARELALQETVPYRVSRTGTKIHNHNARIVNVPLFTEKLCRASRPNTTSAILRLVFTTKKHPA